jgi:hypothetical protein
METWEALTMSRKEVVRPGLVQALVAGQLTNRQVATALRLSLRQVQRLKRRFEAAGRRAWCTGPAAGRLTGDWPPRSETA